MDLVLLQKISLAVAENRDSDTVLRLIVTGLVEQASAALARIWLVVPATTDAPSFLQLAGSAGRSLTPGHPGWSNREGAFSRIPLNRGKVGSIGATGQSVLIEDIAKDGRWIVDKEWAARERIRSFAGHPLVFRGETLGVLGIFSRVLVTEQEFGWFRLFADHAAIALANARAFEEISALRHKLELENQYLREEVSEAAGGIIGSSPAIRNLLRQVDLVAPTEANVLIFGETGTGKELIARAIHDRSARHAKPLVKVNCASVPQELFESEFFGHVRGAFTSAFRDRVGRFQLADRGTLFLDEIGEIPLSMQSKLLRVLQEGELERVGEERTLKVDVRVIAATNRDLRQEMAEGRFREDLYYRLSVFPIHVPPLRERAEDIPVLASHFLQQTSRRLHLPVPQLNEAKTDQLLAYGWPGNIRELQNVVERAVILSRGSGLAFDIPSTNPKLAKRSSVTPDQSLTRNELRTLERESIIRALAAANGRIYGKGGAAEILGMKPTTLSSRISTLGIPRTRQ